MNHDKYNGAWTRLLAARREGDFGDVAKAAASLAKESRRMHKAFVEADRSPLRECSHFMVANGRCINCHEPVSLEKH